MLTIGTRIKVLVAGLWVVGAEGKIIRINEDDPLPYVVRFDRRMLSDYCFDESELECLQ